jgi:anaerobic selenocysteine-containing dehydrogenase
MSGWSRRTFLKTGIVAAAGVAAAGPPRLVAHQKPWNADPGRSLRKYREPAFTACRSCPSHCGLTAFREGGRVVQLLASPGSPTNRGLCARAYAGLERLYDAERLLTPLKRRGDRGGGSWEPVSWEDALGLLREQLEAPGAHRVLHLGQEELLVEELWRPLGFTEVLLDEPFPGRPGPASGRALYGVPTGRPDVLRAETILLLGSRLLDAPGSLPLAADLVEALSGGARMHLVDALQGVTGSLGSWYPAAPGTEGCVGFGIARILLGAGTYRPEEVALRLSDGPERLARALEAYSPRNVEAISGIPAARLERLAQSFAEEQPAVAIGVPGTEGALAAALLNHLSGAVDVPGGVPAARGPFFAPPLQTTRSPEAWARELLGGDVVADLYWAADANPALDSARSAEVGRALRDTRRVGSLVVMDTHLTETARLADLFLPLATPFECWGLLEGTLPDRRSYLFLQQPVAGVTPEPPKLKGPELEHGALFEPQVSPLGEARSLPDVLLALARELGRGLPFADARVYLEDVLRRSRGPGSLDGLRRRGVWVSDEVPAAPLGERAELAAKIPAPRESAPEGLVLLGYTQGGLPRSYPKTPRGREIAWEDRALIHPLTARRLGVGDGGRVRLRTAAGEVIAVVKLIQGIHPRAIALPEGFRSVAQDGERAAEGSAGGSLRGLYPFRTGPDGAQDWGALSVAVERA